MVIIFNRIKHWSHANCFVSVFRINKNKLSIFYDISCFCCAYLLALYRRHLDMKNSHKALFPKYCITNIFNVCKLIIINANKNNAIVSQKIASKHKPRIHH